MTIGENTKAARLRKGMTLEALSKIVGVSRQTLSRYETGVIPNIPPDNVCALAKALEVSSDYLHGLEAPKVKYPRSGEEGCVMTVGELLKALRIGSHKTPARFSDGSGGGDHFLLTLHLVGHGDLLKARVESIEISGGNLFLRAAGQEKEV